MLLNRVLTQMTLFGIKLADSGSSTRSTQDTIFASREMDDLWSFFFLFWLSLNECTKCTLLTGDFCFLEYVKENVGVTS